MARPSAGQVQTASSYDVHRGICYTALGAAEAAIAVFNEGIAAVPTQRLRDRAYYLCWLA